MTTEGQYPEVVSELMLQVRALLPTIPGWCSEEKAESLIRTILGHDLRSCVEIGVFGGSSLIPQAIALRELGSGRIVGIDPWESSAALENMIDPANTEWWSKVNLAEIYSGCLQLIATMGLETYCELLRAKAEDVHDRFDLGSIDLLHIDGNHSELTSTADAERYLPKVRPGGYVFFDDVSWRENGTVTTHKAIEFLKLHCDVRGIVTDCLILQKT